VSELQALLERAAAEPRQLFIGVVLNDADRRTILGRLDNASAEAAAQLNGRVTRPRASKRRQPATSNPKTASRKRPAKASS
jgi:hypothetical protein